MVLNKVPNTYVNFTNALRSSAFYPDFNDYFSAIIWNFDLFGLEDVTRSIWFDFEFPHG